MVYCADCHYIHRRGSIRVGSTRWVCLSKEVAPMAFHPVYREYQVEVLCEEYNKDCDCKYFTPKEEKKPNFFQRWFPTGRW